MTKTRVAVLVRAGLSAWLMFAACGALAQSLLSVPEGPLFVAEGETTVITVSLDSSTSKDVQISYMIRTGTSHELHFRLEGFSYPGVSTKDYTDLTGGAVTISAGDTEANIGISIHDNDEIDGVRELLAIVFPPPSAGTGYRLNPADGSTTILVIKEGICDRNDGIIEAIFDAIPGDGHDCADIDKAAISGPVGVGTVGGIISLNIPRLTEPLRAGDFWDLSKSGILDLSSRVSHELPPGVFSGASILGVLDLSSNTFTTLTPEIFAERGFQQPSPDGSLQELYLSNVPLTELSAGFFGAFIDSKGNAALRGVHLPVDAAGEPLLPLDVGFVRVGEKESTTVADLKLTVVQGAPYDITADLSASRATVSAGGNPVSQLSITRGKTESEVFTLTRTTEEPGVVTATLSSPPPTEDCRRPSAGEDHACYVGVALSTYRPGFRLGAGAPTLRIKLFLEGALE